MPQKWKPVNRSVEFKDFRTNWQNAKGGDPNWYQAMMAKWDEIKSNDARLSFFNQQLLEEIRKKTKTLHKQKQFSPDPPSFLP